MHDFLEDKAISFKLVFAYDRHEALSHDLSEDLGVVREAREENARLQFFHREEKFDVMTEVTSRICLWSWVLGRSKLFLL